MAMLAEPKRKQKWTLNPRGKQWSDDSNKFGQKMLEKMGWTSGKGLGANEQGMTEHVRAKYKDDQAGIGFSKNNQDKLWTEHQESFNMLLQNLQTDKNLPKVRGPMEKEKDLTGKSLELKSKQSRARVHYQKFTRGKDVNKYSTKDLANIFGKRDLNENTKLELDMCESTEKQLDNCVESTDVNGGVFTIIRGTMDDYFKHKMPKISVSRIKSRNDGAAESESDGERYVGFGFLQLNGKLPTKSLEMNNYSYVNPALDLNNFENTMRKRKNEFDSEYPPLNTDDTLNSDRTPKKKRKIRKNYAFENPALDLACPEKLDNVKSIKKKLPASSINIPAVECVIQHNEDYEVITKENMIGGVTGLWTDVIGHENNALDLTDEVNGKKRVTFNDTIEYNTDSMDTNKKKRNKKTSKNKLDKFEVLLDRSAKKKLKNISLTREKNSFINEALDVEVINEESVDNEANERKSKKTRRKKNRPTLNLDTITEEEDVVEVDNKSIVRNLDECAITKKKKKRHQDENGLDLKSINIIEIDECIEVLTLDINTTSKKTKKAKNHMSLGIKTENESENTKENENGANLVDLQDVPQVTSKAEKKKKKKKDREREVTDPDSSVIKTDKQILSDDKNCMDNHGVDDNQVEKHIASKPKKYFRTLFTQRPIAHFIGSNINDLKGYGVEL